MNTELIKDFMRIVQKQSLHCFINPKFELIVEPKYNVYFNVEHVETVFDLQCKVLNWLSRPAHKGCSPYYTKRIKAIINEFLGTEFDYGAMGTIYAHLGNEVNPQLTKYFIHSGFDLNTLLTMRLDMIQGQIEKYQRLGLDASKISDGSHTFEELYYHRMVLFSLICKEKSFKAWKSWKHADGTMYDNYFIVGVDTDEGPFTYHYHNDYWEFFPVRVVDYAPKCDGHTSKDILRIMSLSEGE